MSPSPEREARQHIDAALEAAGWAIQDRATMNLTAATGVAVREFKMVKGHGFADYLLFVNQKAVGALEAKPAGYRLANVELQAGKYATGLPDGLNPPVNPLPFLYLSTGVGTRFINGLDPTRSSPRSASRRLTSYGPSRASSPSGALSQAQHHAWTTTSAVGGGLTFIQLTAGIYHTCGLTSTGAAYCWGNNLSGELGVGEVLGLFDKRLLPTPVAGGISFVQLTASTYNTCGISSAGAAFCWGDNLRGQLGEGRTMPRSLVPTPVTGGLSFVALTAGGSGTCGLTSGGVAYCWGYNVYGQLGDGTTQDRSVPTPVAGALNFGQLTKGSADRLGHTCGRTTAGTVYCWGYNGAGQLGDGTQQSRLVPTPVKSP